MFHILGGAIVGAVVGAVASAATDLVRGKPISWKKLGAAAVGGAAAGAITAATFGAGGAFASSAALKITGLVSAGAAGGATEQVTDNLLHDKPWHEDVAENTAIGAAAGGVLGVGGRALAPLARHGGRLFNAAARRGAQALTRMRTQASRVPGLLRSGGQRGTELARGLWNGGRDGLRRGWGATRRVWGRYMGLLESHPVRTKSATAAAIMAGGDVIAQGVEGRESWDWKRTAFMAAYGAVWTGPVGHVWFKALARWFPGISLRAVASQVAVDQLLMSPIGTVVFFSATGAFKAGSPREAWAEVEKNFWPALKANYVVWPGVQAVNFRFVPQNLRVAFNNVIALGWTAYISMMANEADSPPAADDDGLSGAPMLPGELSQREADEPLASDTPDLATATAQTPEAQTPEAQTPEAQGLVESLKQPR